MARRLRPDPLNVCCEELLSPRRRWGGGPAARAPSARARARAPGSYGAAHAARHGGDPRKPSSTSASMCFECRRAMAHKRRQRHLRRRSRAEGPKLRAGSEVDTASAAQAAPKRPRIDLKSTPSRARAAPISTPSRPEIDPQRCANRAQVAAESPPNRLRIDPELTPNRLRIDATDPESIPLLFCSSLEGPCPNAGKSSTSASGSHLSLHQGVIGGDEGEWVSALIVLVVVWSMSLADAGPGGTTCKSSLLAGSISRHS